MALELVRQFLKSIGRIYYEDRRTNSFIYLTLIIRSMKATLYLPVLLLIFLITACHSEWEDIQPQIDYSEAIQLRKNNFWVYESASFDLASGLRNQELDDSTFIRKDTVANGKVYYIVENLFGLKEYKTTSARTITNFHSHIEFSGINFKDTLYKDPYLQLYGLMKEVKEEVTVPAGTFKTVMFMVLQKNLVGHHDHDVTNPSMYGHDYSIVRKVWYAKRVGVVKAVSYFGNSAGFAINLKRYKVY